MKVLKLTPFEPPAGAEYSFQSYPTRGVYCAASGMIYVVNNGSVFSIPSAANLIEDIGDVGDVVQPSVSLSEQFVLKALAIAQDPSLARDLTRMDS